MDDHFCVISLSFGIKNPINNLQCTYYNWGHLIVFFFLQAADWPTTSFPQNVLLFSCNPIGQLCLSRPSYSNCTVITWGYILVVMQEKYLFL